MIPGARVQAAIHCLDRILAGTAAQQVLTTWGRQNRYAGSKDRAAVRDLVFGALRRRRSSAWIGGAETGRAVMIGALVQDGADLDALFDGQGHAPAPLTAGEGTGNLPDAPASVRADLPDWLWERLLADHGKAAAGIAAALRSRAPVFLRVNLALTDRTAAIAALAADGITAVAHPDVATALEVTANAGRLRNAAAYAGGLVELQDAASQAAVLALPLEPGARVLDFCAGGGGKALAIGAITRGPVWVHDADPGRMADLPARAARAGADLRILNDPSTVAPFDVVLVDAPCSGSGTWRRTPDAKWRLTPQTLDRLCRLQSDILGQAAARVGPGGVLAHATCSVLQVENADRVAEFLESHPCWTAEPPLPHLPGPDGDGFCIQVIRRLA